MTILGKEKLDANGEAVQFKICLAMQFRILGENIWHDAWVDSMSLTALVFRRDEVIETGKTLDIRVILPELPSGRPGGTNLSKAKVTRSWTLPETPRQAFIATALIRPRLHRLSPGNSRRE
jgi:hypothetical protein